MTKTLTDSSTWDDVAVPVDTEDADAASVETPFQTLSDRTRYLLDVIASYLSAAYMNLQEADTTALSTVDGSGVMAGCKGWDSLDVRMHTIIDNDGQTAICEHPGKASATSGGGGVVWNDEADTPTATLSWTAAGTLVDICTGWRSAAYERLAVSNSADAQVAWSSGAGSWGAVNGGVASVAWSACEYGYDGTSDIWVIGGESGDIRTSSNPNSVNFASQTSGLTDDVVRIRSNRKPSTSHQFLALDDSGNVSVSDADGTTWEETLVASLGLSSTLKSITWDAKNDRWVGVQYDGARAWSSDGKTWTESADDELPDFTAAAGNRFFLDADDQGNLTLSVHSTGNRALLYVAGNGGEDMPNGRPWEEVFYPDIYTYAKVSFIGWGRVITAGSSGILYSDQTHTTREAAL